MKIPKSVLAKMALGAAGLSPLPFLIQGSSGNAAPASAKTATPTAAPAATATPRPTVTPLPTSTPNPRLTPVAPRYIDPCPGCGMG